MASFILKKLVYWRKSEVKVSWGVCDFMNYSFDAFVFLRLMPFGEIATWVSLDWKGRALPKSGVVYGTSVFGKESVDGKQRKDFYVVSYNDEPCLGMVIFRTYLQCSSEFENFFSWMGEGGREIRTCTKCCLRDILIWKLLNSLLYTNQNSCKCLRKAIQWWAGQYLERCMVMEFRRFD